MENARLIISQNDFDLLQSHLKLSSNLSEFNRKKLNEELQSARIMRLEDLPDDIVATNSQVEIEEVAGGQRFTFQLVSPDEADMKKYKLSVLAPIGVALLGYGVGAEVQWEMPNGLKTFRIVNVTRDVLDVEPAVK
ncbi:GreA/GreB family elongation factor [Pedobacter sp. BS3]|uniref:GreA/GreB family elongation factor n=1 Tax=Pedobacter sp. BS3 TaxID=2567937 RepID=UPI0011ED533A|nr:GreA/GreB family elongation factor [Pedobacter sp. BS3]TZF81191.1 GreA/GreB family elongation factor [Pedobacter sp. BS3]